jgi:hypothetical protein
MLLYGDHLAPKRSERATWYEELTRDILTLRERHEDTINALEYAQSVDSIGAQLPEHSFSRTTLINMLQL